MSDATEPRPTTPFPKSGEAMPAHVAADPLAGDWSEGLRGPVRALGIVEARRLQIDGVIPPPVVHFEPAPVAPVAEEVEAPDAWGASSEGPLHSSPPPQSEPPSVIVTFTDPPPSAPPPSDVTPPTPAPAFQPDITPSSPAPAFQPDITPASPAPAFQPDITPASPAPAFQPDITPASPAPAFLPGFTPASASPALLPEVAATPAPQPLHGEGGVVEHRPEGAADAGAAATAAPAATDSSAHASDAQSWANAIAASPDTHSGPTPWSEPMAPAPPAPAADPWKDAPIAMPAAHAEAAPSWDQVTAAVGTPAVVPVPAAWDMRPPAAPAPVDDAWSAPPPAAEQVTEWKAEAPAEDWQEIKRPQPEMAAPPPADWGTLSSGPDWSSAPPPQAAAAEETWGSAPPPPSASAWDAAPAPAAPGAWEAPAAPEETEWTAPAPVPAAAASWNAAPVGASALEQMDSEPADIEPAPGAAQELFGSVPVGASLSGDDDAPPEDLGPPEELASPEEVLKPVELSDDDADLLVPVDEDAPPPPPRPAATLAAMRPAAFGALEVRGEHRVAVHTRGGRTRRGTITDIDLGKSQFSLVPQGGGAAEPVYHAEVKAIFFMLAPGEKVKAPDGGKVRVTFADGRSIEGHRDGAEAKHGFFLVPSDAARTNTRRIYVAREATTDVKDG